MNNTSFKKVVANASARVKATLMAKNKEYTRSQDRLANFKRSGRILGILPEQALLTFYIKHLECMMSIIDDIERGELPSEELLTDKVIDLVNYPILFEALVLERIEQMRTPSNCSNKPAGKCPTSEYGPRTM